MGKKKNKKEKKGKGAEKTAAKTAKKDAKRLRKELEEKGEEDIEKMIAAFQLEDQQLRQAHDELCPPPSPRCNMTLTPHPDKDELIMFGGEYFNGSKTFVYNDLYIYSIKKNEWSKWHVPNGPSPRCAHQAVALSQGGGQLWVFGGEFASPTQTQFHHYKDLWLLHLAEKRWEKINTPNGPSSRSGHRMVVLKRLIIVFGGFHDKIRDYKYFNDVHAFDLDSYSWTKLGVSGSPPSPRSACQMTARSDGCALVYGGYSKQRVKKEVDAGTTHSDMFLLSPVQDGKDSKGTSGLAAASWWKWTKLSQGGDKPGPRCGFSLVGVGGDRALLFGGVEDLQEDEEELQGVFHGDLYQLDLKQGRWHQVVLRGKRSALAPGKKRRRRRVKEEDDKAGSETGSEVESSEGEEEEEDLSPAGSASPDPGPGTDGVAAAGGKEEEEEDVFKVVPGVCVTARPARVETDSRERERSPEVPAPPARMNGLVAVKRGSLYLYGGLLEEGDKQVTLSDMYTLDLHKMDQWNTLLSLDAKTQEWLESSSSEGEDEGEMSGDSDSSTDGDVPG